MNKNNDKKSVGKTHMTKHLEVNFRMSEDEASEVIDSLLNLIQTSLVRGDKVLLSNICTLSAVRTEEKQKVVFGKDTTIAAGYKLKCRPSNNMGVIFSVVNDERKNKERDDMLDLSETVKKIKID